jgi:hypothetical protein
VLPSTQVGPPYSGMPPFETIQNGTCDKSCHNGGQQAAVERIWCSDRLATEIQIVAGAPPLPSRMSRFSPSQIWLPLWVVLGFGDGVRGPRGYVSFGFPILFSFISLFYFPVSTFFWLICITMSAEPLNLTAQELQTLREPILKYILDLRSTLAKKACETCALLAEKCPAAFSSSSQVRIASLHSELILPKAVSLVSAFASS